MFCFYYGIIGQSEKGCAKRRKDMSQNCVLNDQYGYWLTAGPRRVDQIENKRNRTEQDKSEQRGKRIRMCTNSGSVIEIDKEGCRKESESIEIIEI